MLVSGRGVKGHTEIHRALSVSVPSLRHLSQSASKDRSFVLVNSFRAVNLTWLALLFGGHGQVAYHDGSGWPMRLLTSR